MVTDYEHATLEWLAGWETSTVAVVAGLMHRCREARPLATQPPADERPECLDCGHHFDPDSSPELDRCWSCAERADTEAVTR